MMHIQIFISKTHIIKFITGSKINREVLLQSSDVTLRRLPSINPEPVDVHINSHTADAYRIEPHNADVHSTGISFLYFRWRHIIVLDYCRYTLSNNNNNNDNK